MGQLLDFYLPYDTGPGGTTMEDQWRAMARLWLSDGPVRGESTEFQVITAAGRNVTVRAGQCWIEGHWGVLGTPFTQPLGANVSGNPRIDTVVLRNDFGANTISIEVLVGTPAGSPSPPALTQNTSVWEIPLADVRCANGFTSPISSDITDRRVFAAGRPPGGPLVVQARAVRSTNLSVPNATWTPLVLDTQEDYDTGGLHSLVTHPEWFTVPPGMPGTWCTSLLLKMAASNAGDRSVKVERAGPSGTFEHILKTVRAPSDNTFPWQTNDFYEDDFVPGDTINWSTYQGSGGALNVTYAMATFRYLGPITAP